MGRGGTRASLLGFLPIGEEAFEADVGHGVFPEFFEDGVGHGADVGAGMCAPPRRALEQCVREVTVSPRALLALRLRSLRLCSLRLCSLRLCSGQAGQAGKAPRWHTGGRNARPTLNPKTFAPRRQLDPR